MNTLLHLPDRPLRVVALGAHPDDIEIGCGGTLLALAERGLVELRTLVMTGTPERRAEAESAAQAFGATHPPVFCDVPDGRMPAHWNAVKTALHDFRDAMRAPDLVFAPRADDAHQDHRLLGELAATVWRGPTVLHYEIPKWDGDLGAPNVYVPLPDALVARKVERLFAAFPSQHSRDWWDEEFFRSILRLRGAESQTRYAEAFFGSKLTLAIGGAS